MKDSEKRFYKGLVTYAQQNRNEEKTKLIEGLKTEALKAFAVVVKSEVPNANLTVLKKESLSAIAALSGTQKDKSTEWKDFDEAFKGFDEALTNCAEDMVAVAKNPKVQPSTLPRILHTARNVLGAIAAVLATGFAAALSTPVLDAYARKSPMGPVVAAVLIMIVCGVGALVSGAVEIALVSKSEEELGKAIKECQVALNPIINACKTLEEALGRTTQDRSV